MNQDNWRNPRAKRIPDSLTIYDVLRVIIGNIVWRDESELLRLTKAIQVAEQNDLFGNGGYFTL